MKRTTIMLPEDLTAKVRERVGGQGLSPLVRDLLTAWLADGPLPVSAPSKREPKPEVGTTDSLAGVVKAGKREASEFAAAVDDRCKHPKSRRSRGQCMACFAYLDKP